MTILIITHVFIFSYFVFFFTTKLFHMYVYSQISNSLNRFMYMAIYLPSRLRYLLF